METQKLRTLKILEAVDNGDAPSQRDLARQLNISLGLVNSFVKRLVNKGYFKITNIPRNRVRYILTPKGAAEKTRLTYEYIQYSFQFYKEGRKKIENLFLKLSEEGIRQVVFYGASELAEIAYLFLQETDMSLTAVVDQNREEQMFLKKRVIAPDALPTITFDCILLTTMEDKQKAREEIVLLGIEESKIRVMD